jgi:hypothetical protein
MSNPLLDGVVLMLQFTLKITRGNTVVAPEKLWFLQKAHAQRFAASGGPEFDEMVSRVCRVVEETYPADQLYVLGLSAAMILTVKGPQSSNPAPLQPTLLRSSVRTPSHTRPHETLSSVTRPSSAPLWTGRRTPQPRHPKANLHQKRPLRLALEFPSRLCILPQQLSAWSRSPTGI